MHIPDALAPLFDDGIIERVVRPLMSGKEAQVFLVVSQGQLRVAKVYKDANLRSFKHRAEYTEGRKTRNSRDQRAIGKRSKHGREQDEAAWKSTEIDMIHRLHNGGVRVPVPYAFSDGVLVMECVVDADGDPAPRLGDIAFDPDSARRIYDRVIQEIVRMLAVGVVHGDLSDFNVLVSGEEPVIIDFPQSVDTASNTNARRLLLRDVDNMHRFLSKYVPRAPRLPYAEEMWELHESNALTADTRLTGRFRPTQRRTSDESVLGLIQDANYDERKRRDALGLRGGPSAAPPAPRGFPSGERRPQGQGQGQRPQHQSPSQGARQPQQQSQGRQQQPQHGRGPRPQQQPQHDRGPRPQHAQGRQHQPSRGPQPQQPQQSQHGRGPRPQHAQGRQQQPSRGPQAPATHPRHDGDARRNGPSEPRDSRGHTTDGDPTKPPRDRR